MFHLTLSVLYFLTHDDVNQPQTGINALKVRFRTSRAKFTTEFHGSAEYSYSVILFLHCIRQVAPRYLSAE